MAQKAENPPFNRPSATSPKDVSLLRVQNSFDEIVETLVQDCYSNDDTKRALDLIKWVRTYAHKAIKDNLVC